jgi:hypothetical protein
MSRPNWGRATVEVSADLLREALHMPSGTRIIGVSIDTFRDLVALRVEHVDLPGDLDGINPTITHTVESYEWDWNLP